jgi:hypothetical protein
VSVPACLLLLYGDSGKILAATRNLTILTGYNQDAPEALGVDRGVDQEGPKSAGEEKDEDAEKVRRDQNRVTRDGIHLESSHTR